MDLHDNNIEPGIDPDCVCPVCYRTCPPACSEGEQIAEGIRRRSYSVWCPECSRTGRGYIVIQYYHGGRWRIEKYIPIKPVYVMEGDWIGVQQAQPEQVEQTEEPILQFGPGGDFVSKTSDVKLAQAIQTYNDLIAKMFSCGQAIKDILLMKK